MTTIEKARALLKEVHDNKIEGKIVFARAIQDIGTFYEQAYQELEASIADKVKAERKRIVRLIDNIEESIIKNGLFIGYKLWGEIRNEIVKAIEGKE